MPKAQLILRLVTGVLFLVAAALFYGMADGNRTMELIALVFLVVGALNFVLTFVLNRVLERLKKG
jgi:hypothetical protein